ncbi:MAG: 16S rRNA (cytosine(1402)-N(4))-methyltransferase RsmH [Tissierellales bacterium]|nr:16S rRNA (cytosine(1402)-N(4))-methyltransferase RsmH [Tissierellales bacterium]MBN2827655.1 16S rRNA (cytosine(1402)-N(4))-methyltransferase RsmH [Tissierellales bacterium]
MDFFHKPVLLEKSLEGLNIKKNGIYVDCTLGGGGHTTEIAKRCTLGKLIAIDQDMDAIENFKSKYSELDNVITINGNFKDVKEILLNINIEHIDGALMDLGVSSFQLDNPERGFSYMQDAILDMRMDANQKTTARHIINGYTEEELRRIFYEYGEEKWAARIAKFIIEERNNNFIETTGQLVDVIKKAIPKSARRDGPHPAKRTFQAIRIEVNKELEILENTITDLSEMLNSKGRLCIITFHSLEDRIVKNTYKFLEKDCLCPPGQPICTCEKTKTIKIISKKPILPDEDELEMNPRARSAKLRIAEKI